MKKHIFLLIILISTIIPLSAQSRIPKESGNWLSSSNSGTSGGYDGINVIFFEVPDTETRTLYFAVRDPGVFVNFTDEDSGSINALGGPEPMKFTLVGGTGTISNSDSKKYYYTVSDEAYTPATENSGFLEQKVYGTGDTTTSWVYFGGVSPSQGEHIGNKYYFKVVCHATSGALDSGYKNGYQLDVSTSTGGTPTGVSGIRSFAYSWCVNLTERDKEWNLYPYVPDNNLNQFIIAGLFDFDADDPVIAANPSANLYDKVPESGFTPCTPSGAADPPIGDGNVYNTSVQITPDTEDYGTWRLQILEGTASVGINTSEIWVWEDSIAAGPYDYPDPDPAVDTVYRIYADVYTGLASPSDPDKVISSYDDGTASTGETERITCMLTDTDGNPINAVRTFSLSIDVGTITSVNSSSTIDTGITATMTTDDFGTAWYEVTMAAADITSNISWVNGGAGTFSTTGSDTSVVVTYVADPEPDLSSAANKSSIEGSAPSPDTLPDIVITDSGLANILSGADIRISIPLGLNAVFDTTASVTATITGTGTGRLDDNQSGAALGTGSLSVTDTLDYETVLVANDTAVIDIQLGFAVGDILTISGLKLNWLAATESSGSLGMSVTGASPFPITDDKLISINSSSSSTTAVWIGGEVGFENDWNRPNNWSNTDVPDTVSETAEIPITINQPQLPVGYDLTVDSISIVSGATLTTGANNLTANSIIIGGTLDASAQVNGSDVLTVNNNISGGGTLIGGAGNITVNGALTVSNFTASSNDTNIGGNFSSVLTHNTGTIILDTTADSVISNTGDYNDLTINADKTLAANMNITGTLNVGTATLDTASYNLSAATLTHNSGGGITGTTGTISIADSTLGEDITKTGGNISFTGGSVSLGGAVILNTGALAGGDITLSSTFNNNQVLTATAGTGSITVSGVLGGGTALGAVSLTASTAINIGANISAAALTFTGPVNLTAGPLTLTGTDVNFTSTLDGGQNLIVNGSGTTTFSGLVGGTPLISITTDAAGSTAINTTAVTTSGIQTYNDNVSLGADPVITGTAITFNGTIDNGQNLVINGSGVTTFADLVGNGTALTSLTTDAAGSTTISTAEITTTGNQTYNDGVSLTVDTILTGAVPSFASVAGGNNNLTLSFTGLTSIDGSFVNINNLTSNNTGTTDLSGAILTNGFQLYSDAVTLSADTTLTGTVLTFSNTLDNARNLVLNGSGITTFGGLVGNGTALTSITTDVAGSTAINTTVVRTSGIQTYNDNVTLGADPVITGTAITFNGTIDNAQNLTINGSGVTTFADLVGNGTALTSITTDLAGSTAINTTVVRTSGIQTYNDNVTLGADPVITGTAITFNGTIDNGQNLVINGSGVTTFADLVGNGTALTSITTDLAGSTAINTTVVTTSGIQTYNDNVTLGADPVITGTAITFNGTIDNAQNLTINGSGVTTFADLVGNGTALTSITTDVAGSTAINTTAVRTSGIQTYNDNVTLGADPVITGTAITFNGTIDNGQNLVINGSGVTTFADLVGNGTALTSITTDLAGSTAINTTIVRTSGIQTYNDNVTLGADPVITGTAITFNGTIDNGQNLVINGSGVTTFADLVGNGTALTSITTDLAGSTAINTTVVRTSGIQTYNDNVTLGADPVITGTAITFNGTIDNGQNLVINGSGVTTFADLVGNGTALTSLTTDAAGSTTISTAEITTTGNQTYNDGVSLTVDTVLTGAVPSFASVAGGNNNLTLSFTGLTSIDGSFVNINNLTSNNTGTTDLSGAILTNGFQLYSDAVTLSADTTLTGTVLTFSNTLDNARNLVLNGSGITTFGGLVGNGTALTSITTDLAGSTAINTTVVRTSGIQTYNDNVSLGADPVITGTAITFNGTIDNAQNLTINGSGVTTFADLVGNGTALTSITTDLAGSTAINTTVVRTSGIQTYNDNVTLGADPVITGTAITFNGTIDNGQNLVINGSGVTTFADLVGNGTALTSITTDLAGSTAINTTVVRTSGIQTYNDNVTLGADPVITGTAITFNGTIDNGQNLVINGSGVTTFADLVGNGTALTSLTTDAAGSTTISTAEITTTGNQTYNDGVSLTVDTVLTGAVPSFASVAGGNNNLTLSFTGLTSIDGSFVNINNLTSNNTGTTDLSGAILTNGFQLYSDAVTLSADTTLTGTVLTFSNTLDNARNLVLNGSGITTFGGLVGNGTALTSITTDLAGSTAINTTVVRTSGIQTYNDNVSLGADPVITGTAITFNGTIDNGQNLVINGSGVTTFADLVGNGTALTSITTDLAGSTAINTTVVRTSGIQTYNDNVTLGADPVITGTAITFNGTIDNGQNLVINGSGVTTFADLVGNGTALTSITTDLAGSTAINTTVVTTSGIQTYNDNVTLGADPVITGTAITFNGTIDNAQNLTINGSGVTTFADLVGNGTALTSITTDVAGSTAINTTAVRTSGIQTYNDNVTLGADPVITGTAITFNGTIDNGQNLVINGSGVTTFADLVGNGTALTSITTDLAGSTAINTTVVRTSGIQTYNDNVTLGADPVITGTAITFNGTIDNGQNLVINGSGVTTFADLVGNGTALTSITTDLAGSTAINTTVVRTSGIQTYNDNVTLGADPVITGTAITFNGTIDNGQNLVINGSGVTTFADLVGNGTALTSLTTDAAGSTTISTAEITTTGNQTYNDGVSLTVDTVLTGAVPSFASVAGGNNNLTLSFTGLTSIDGSFVNINNLTSNNTGTTDLSGAILTNGFQLYSDAVTLSADTTLTGTVLTFSNTLDNARNLVLNGSGITTFGGLVGNGTALTSITTDLAGSTAINTTVVRTSGIQTYNDNVSLGADPVITGTAITFNGTIDNGQNLVINGSGVTTFADLVGNGTALTSLTTDAAGSTAINTTAVTTTGVQVYNDNVNLLSNTTLSGTTVTFNGTTDGGTNTLAITGNAVFGNAVGDTVTNVSTLTVSGTTLINTSAITTMTTQSYNLAVTLGEDVTLTGTSGTFTTGVIGGGNSLVLDFSGVTLINGTFTGILNLTSGNGGTTQLSGNITTTGYQSYSDAVSVVAASVLTTTDSNVSFANTVIGNSSYSENLTLNTGAGNINFGDTVGAGVGNELGDIVISNAANVRFWGTLEADSITQAAGTGTTVFDSNITIRGAGATAGAAADINLTGAAFTFDAPTDTLTGGSGGSVAIANTGALTIANLAHMSLDGSFAQTGAGAVSIGGNITTTNDDAGFTSAVSLTNNITVNTGAGIGDITFTSTVDDADATPDSLTLTAGQGDVALSSAAGSIQPLSSLTITGNDITLTGIGGAASGVSGNVIVTGTDAGDNSRVTLNGSDYWSTGTQIYNSGTDQCLVALSGNGDFNAGGAGFTFDDVYFDFPVGTITMFADVSCNQFVFYRGTINLNSRTLSTITDFAVFGSDGPYNPNDSDFTAANTYFAYPGAGAFSYYPADGTYNAAAVFSTVPTSNLTIPAGSVITVGGNFYNNGTNMDGAGAWTLNIQDNSASDPVTNGLWGTPYAVAFNMSVTNSTAAGGWVAATESQGGVPAESNNNVTDSGGCTNWDFTRPQITSAETVYDNVIRVTFSENIENSNGEIASRAGSVLLNNNTIVFTGAFTDPECTTATGNTEPINIIYLQTATSWNTDAIGDGSLSAVANSTDRSGVAKNITPDISMLKGIFYSAEGKTFVRNYNNNTYAVYSATADECRPVLAAVTAGRDSGTAQAYNYHNYFQLNYSEPVNIGTDAAFIIGGAAANVRAQNSFGAGEYGGSIEQNGADVDVTGLFSYPTATITKGSKDATPEINSLYRANTGAAANNAGDNGLRIFLAGYSTGADPNQIYPGYIETVSDPVGETITVPANALITDNSGNVLENTAGSIYAKAAVVISAAGSGWDVDRPIIAAFKPGGVAGTYHEILTRDTDVDDLIDRLEFHVHDNSAAEAAWDSTGDHPNLTADVGIRDTSVTNGSTGFTINSFGNATIRPASGFSLATDVENSLYEPGGPPYLINTPDDMYFTMTFIDSELPLNYLTRIILSYDSNTGFITDLSGNLLRDETDINCYEQVPPEFSYTLSVVGDNKVYVKFSEYVYGDAAASLQITGADFVVNGGGGFTVSSVEARETNPLDSNAILTAYLILDGTLDADDAVTQSLAPLDGSSIYDGLGVAMDASEEHRITDIGMGVIEPVWADDGIQSESIQSGGTLKVFDGTGRVHDNDINLQASIRASSAEDSSATIYYDADVSSSYYWKNIWLPVLIPGFTPLGNTDARGSSAYSSSGSLRNFLIPENDKDMTTGNNLDFLIRLGDLYCARAANPKDPTTVEPWSVKVRGVKKQRSGVTILNNVINPREGEKAVLQYDLGTSGTVTINIFSLSGDVVKTLFKGRQSTGRYSFPWDGKNTGGRAVARGIYFIRIVGPEIDEYRKVMVVK